MNKFNVLILTTLVLFAGSFGSCKKDQDIAAPKISFDAANNPLTLGTGVSSYAITGSIYSEAGLDTVRVFLICNNEGGILDKSYNSFSSGDIITTDKLNYTFHFNYTNINASLKIQIRATDKNGKKTDSEILVINPETPTAGNIIKYVGKVLGGPNNYTIEHAFSTITGQTYSKSNARTYPGEIDFIYLYSSIPTELAEIMSPFYASVYYDSFVSTNWGQYNSTKFHKTTVVTSSEFDEMRDDTMITMALTGITWNSDQTVQNPDGRLINLAVKDIFAFKTEAGKFGLAKVTALTEGESGSITISVNVQQ